MNFILKLIGRSGLSAHTPDVAEFLSLLLLARRLSDLPADKTLGTRKTKRKSPIERFASDYRFKSAVLWPAMSNKPTHHSFLADGDIAELSQLASRLLGLKGLSATRTGLAQDLAMMLAHEALEAGISAAVGSVQYQAMITGLGASQQQPRSPIIGYLDGTSGMLLRGWAVNTATPDIRPRLNIFVNGTFAGQLTTNLMRPELAARHGGDGFFGFEFRLRPAPDQTQYQYVPVRLEDADNGSAVLEAQVLLGHDSGMLLRLETIGQRLDDLARRGVSAESKGVQNQISQLSSLLPRINKYQFTPFEHYRAHYDLASQSVQSAAVDQPLAPLHRLIIGTDLGNNWQLADLVAACDTLPNDGLIMISAPEDHPIEQALLSLRRYAASAAAADIKLFMGNYVAADLPVLQNRFDPFACAASNPLGRAGVMRKGAIRQMIRCFPALADHMFTGGQMAAIYLAIYLEFGTAQIANHHEPLFATPHHINGLDDISAHMDAVNAVLTSADADWRVDILEDQFAKAPASICRVSAARQSTEMLSVIIPTRNAIDLTRDCINSLFATMAEPEQVEIILVDNQSDDADTLAWMEALDKRPNCRVLRHDAPFNWSEINNVAAAKARGNMLLFLNNDTLALHKGWDVITRNLLTISSVGALGARLLYEDASIQHAGVVLYDVGVAKHEGIGESCNDGGYLLRTRQDHLCAAVTGAYLACRRADFDALGGFNADDLSVTFNDIDFCLRIRERGLGVLYSPQITFNHLESKSRGYDYMDPKKRIRAEAERDWMEARWAHELGADPYYPPEMARQGAAFALLKGLDMFSGKTATSGLKG